MSSRIAAKRKVGEPVEICSDESENDFFQPEFTSEFPKSFAIEHVFKDVLTWAVDSTEYSSPMEHFGVDWFISLKRYENNVGICLCRKKIKSERIKINVEKMEVKTQNYYSFTTNNLSFDSEDSDIHFYGQWDSVNCLTEQDDSVSVKFVVAIPHSEGLIEGKDHFDEEKRDVSDAKLFVDNKCFYVAKQFLATHSTTFKSMLVNGPTDEHVEMTFDNVDPTDMQAYLEVLYLYRDIDENTAEGLILLGRQLQTDIILDKCQKFLIYKSVKELHKKFQLSIKYGLDELLTWCFDNMNTHQDVKMCAPDDLTCLDPEVMAMLLQKSLSFA